jgi:ankyrin repeat protein
MKYRIVTLIIVLSILFTFYTTLLFAADIHDAARDKNLEKLIRLAVDAPDSLYTLCSMGKTPLHWATGMGHTDIMKVLLDRFKVPVDIANANNGTPLHVAASQARPECVEILINHGADLNARVKDGATPLHFACFKGQKQGHLECIKMLLEKGCDPNAEMKNHATPMNLAFSRNNTEVINLLKKYGGKKGIIDRSINMGSYDFEGGTAYKKDLNNKNKPENNIFEDNTFSNSDSSLKNMPFNQRKKIILKRFDLNNDGILDYQEKEEARNFMNNMRNMKNRTK